MLIGYENLHKSFLKKIFSKPDPVARLMKRTFSTACAVLSDLDGTDYREITVSLHNFLSELPCDVRLLDSFESQMELAGANHDKFIRNFQQSYKDLSHFFMKVNWRK